MPADYKGENYTIGTDAFKGNATITSVVIPNRVTSIGDDAFAYCDGLTSITIPNSVTSIGNYAFSRCTGLTSITIPNSVTSIGDYAFRDCSGLTSITIPNSVTSIGYYAFYNCSGLKTVYNFSNLTFSIRSSDNGYIAYYATKVYNAPNGSIEGDFIFGKPNDVNTLVGYLGNATEITLPADYKGENYVIGADAFNGNTTITSITIPNSVTSIGSYAFYYCSGLTSITIPNSVTSIGDDAFYKCTGLTSITIPNSVTSIGNLAFYYCSGLTSITIPNSVTSIGERAFDGCKGLTGIKIPNSVTSIGERTFQGCSGLTSITVAAGNAKYDSRDNCNAIIETETNTLIAGCKNTIIPNSVTSIEYGAFNGCSGLTSIEIPNSVTSIGNRAFWDCTGLTSITIPNSVTSIGDRAFASCTGLKTVYNFSNLTFTKGSSNNGYIAYYADKVYNAPNGSMEGDFIFGKPNDVNTLLYYLGNATELTLPADYNGENYVIGNYAFYDCSGLTSITIPNSVTSIGEEAFNGCSNLETIYISSAIESIGNRAFAGCDNIKEIKLGAKKPIRGSADIFTNAVYDNATLYIPNGTEQLYQKREPWNLFFYIVEMDFTGIDKVYDEVKGEPTVDASQIGKVKTVYDLNGRVVENPSSGIYIINGKKCWLSESGD